MVMIIPYKTYLKKGAAPAGNNFLTSKGNHKITFFSVMVDPIMAHERFFNLENLWFIFMYTLDDYSCLLYRSRHQIIFHLKDVPPH